MKPSIARLPAIGAAIAAVVALAGCAHTADPGHPELRPTPLAEFKRADRPEGPGRPKIALVLGGGGLRGFAHVGVIRALEETGVRPDIVVGTSAGAVVGAAYASGMSSEQIAATARSVKISSLIDLTWTSGGFMRGDSLAKWVDSMTRGVPIERFPVRFAAVATDLDTAAPVVIDQGPAGRAIQASAAVPGATVPVAYAGGHLIDGGITSLVPVRTARALGADVVIAVDIYCQEERATVMSVMSMLSRTMRTQSCLIAAPEMAEADVLIAPAITVSGMSDKEQHARAIQAGYEAARAALPRLLQGVSQVAERSDKS